MQRGAGGGRGGGMGGGRGGGRGMGGGRGGGRGMGGGMGRGMGAGRGGTCVCPRCGYKVEHIPGNPCVNQSCPHCNVPLVRGE